MSDRPWLASYPKGVPAEIDFSQYDSLGSLLENAFLTHKDKTAFVCLGTSLSYAQLDRLSRDFGAYLQSLGLKKGARVALMLPNLLQYPIALAAVIRAGYVVVNVNPLYTKRELEVQLIDSGAEAIVVLENFAAPLSMIIEKTSVKHVITTQAGDALAGVRKYMVNWMVKYWKRLIPKFHLPKSIRWANALRIGAKKVLHPVPLQPEDLAFLQYTGGTTGIAKGAMLCHRNILANIAQGEAWKHPAMVNPRLPPLPENGVCVGALPLYHVFAMTVSLTCMRAGIAVLLIPNPRDMQEFVKTLAQHQSRITLFPGVNTLYKALLNSPEFLQLSFPALRVSLGGGMAVEEVVAKRWLEVVKNPICEGYGLSETSPMVIANPTDTDAFSGTIGYPMPSTEARILGENDIPLPIGEVGELAVRGPQVMLGYWQQPDETANVMTSDGFFKTGDIAVMNPQGMIKIVDRKKDMILVSGFNVYPNEIENVVSKHPLVLESAAIGVPDERSGESIRLYVVAKSAELTKELVMAHCKEQLTGYKCPKEVVFIESLPKSNVGKILRRELKDQK